MRCQPDVVVRRQLCILNPDGIGSATGSATPVCSKANRDAFVAISKLGLHDQDPAFLLFQCLGCVQLPSTSLITR